MPVHNADITAIFEEIADLLEIQGANPFRIRAYRNAALTLGDLSQDARVLAERGDDLTRLPGIGDDLAAKISEIVSTGHCSLLDRLRKELPPAITELLKIPGLGPKRVKALYHDLDVQTIEQLQRAAQDGRIRALHGFGEKTEQNILQAVAAHTGQSHRFKLATAAQYAEALRAFLQVIPGVRVLQAARIDACALANNHILDYEEQGLRDTLRVLKAANIQYAGAGANATEAAAPVMLDAPGTAPCRVALLSCTDNEPDFAASTAHPGTNYLKVALDKETLARIANSIAQARTQGADLVVFSNHWGANFVERPSSEFRSFARRVIELGADIYYGHSAHICQGIEIYQGKPILYDTGNFIDDYAVHPLLRNDRSCLFKVTFAQGELRRIELLPVSLNVARVALARDKEFEAICARMEMLCAEFGTTLMRQPDRLVYEA